MQRTHRLSCDLCMRLCDACVAAYLHARCVCASSCVRTCVRVHARARWLVARRLVHCAVRGGVAAAATPPAASFDWNAHAYAPQPFNPYAYHYGPATHSAPRPPSRPTLTRTRRRAAAH